MTREEMTEKIKLIEKAIMFAGPIHGRDLRKHLYRMRIELKEYDRYQKEARKTVLING